MLPAITDVHSKIPKDCAEHAVACFSLQFVYLLVYLFSWVQFFFHELFFSVFSPYISLFIAWFVKFCLSIHAEFAVVYLVPRHSFLLKKFHCNLLLTYLRIVV